MIDAYTILILRSIGVAGFAVIGLIGTGLLVASRRNGITYAFAACTAVMAILAASIFYTGLSNILSRELPQSTLDFNYWHWARETVFWWLSIVTHGWLGITLLFSRRKSSTVEQIASRFGLAAHIVQDIIREACD